MGAPDTNKSYLVTGRLAHSCTDLTAAWPHGGVGLGTVGSVFFDPPDSSIKLAAEEDNVTRSVIWIGGDAVMGCRLESWDADALSAVFPNAATDINGNPVISWPGNTKPGQELNSLTNLVFTPRNQTEHPWVILYNPVPIVDADIRLQFSAVRWLSFPVLFMALPGSGRTGIAATIGTFASGTTPPLIPEPPETGLALWLDADNSSSITTSGSEVTAWADQSENAYSFTVPSGAGRPTLTTVPVGGVTRGAIEFTATSNGSAGDGLSGTFPVSEDPYYCYFVFTVEGVNTTGGTFFNMTPTTLATDDDAFLFHQGSLSGSFIRYYHGDQNTGNSDSAYVTPDEILVASVVTSGDIATIDLLAEASNNTSVGYDLDDLTTLNIGHRNRVTFGRGQYQSMKCLEVIVYSSAPDTDDLTSYLEYKYGVTL